MDFSRLFSKAFFHKTSGPFSYESVTKIGDRDMNEDSVLCVVRQNGSFCFVVADGLGGHGKGEVASQTLVSVFKEEFDKTAAIDTGMDKDTDKDKDKDKDSDTDRDAGAAVPPTTESFLVTAFLAAQKRIMTAQKESFAHFDMKTTAVALVAFDGKCRFGHIGDSRLYLYGKNERFITRTRDHSVPEMLFRAKEIRERDIARHPDRNRLLRVAGMEWDAHQFDLSDEFYLADCGGFLLCSDGFWELIDETKIRALFKRSASASEWLSGMLAEVETAANPQKSMDNYSAVAVYNKGL